MIRTVLKKLMRFSNHPKSSPWDNPHFGPPPCYTLESADEVYRPLLDLCFEYFNGTQIQGDIYEFGTFKGYTARLISENMASRNWKGKLHLFDSFEGLPELDTSCDLNSYEVAVNKSWFKGQMKLYPGIVSAIAGALSETIGTNNFVIHPGFYKDTLPELVSDNKIALCNIDCDLYGSTWTVLNHLIENDLFHDGSIILFDDYNCNRAQPAMGERKAISELFGENKAYTISLFYAYGWHGQSFFIHKNKGMGL